MKAARSRLNLALGVCVTALVVALAALRINATPVGPQAVEAPSAPVPLLGVAPIIPGASAPLIEGAPTETSDWSTYTSHNPGWSVKYPPYWHAREEFESGGTTYVYFGEGGTTYWTEGSASDWIIVILTYATEKPNVLPLAELIRRRQQGGARASSVVVDGITATRLTGGLFADSVWFEHQGHIYSLSVGGGADSKVVRVLDAMIMSFRIDAD